MTILSSQSIMRRRPIVDPQPRTKQLHGGKLISYGCGPASYDLRLDRVDTYADWYDGPFRIEPGEFVLASAMEEFQMPDDLAGMVHDKSTWARQKLSAFNTLIDPGFRGFLTLELVNHGSETITLYRGAGICQVVFHLLDEPTYHPYGAGDKYQNQARGPQSAR